MPDKDIVWLGSSKDDISQFPGDAKQYAGFQLRLVQKGLDPDDAKAISTVGPGTVESYRELIAAGKALARTPNEAKRGKKR